MSRLFRVQGILLEDPEGNITKGHREATLELILDDNGGHGTVIGARVIDISYLEGVDDEPTIPAPVE